jgi:DnaJ-class molecular chaperone
MEYTCEKCNGTGTIGFYVEPFEIMIRGMIQKSPGKMIKDNCTFCNGRGKLDWVENILGVSDKIGASGYSTVVGYGGNLEHAMPNL